MQERRPLDATELADAAMTAALVMALQTSGRLLGAGVFFQVFSTLAMTALAARHRMRVVASATVAAISLTVLLGGIGPVSHAFIAGVLGWANGTGIRRRLGLGRHVGRAIAIAWPPITVLSVGLLLIFAEFRELTLDNARNNWAGVARILDGMGVGTDTLGRGVLWTIDHWWLFVPIVELLVTIGYALVIRRLGRLAIDRLDAAMGSTLHQQLPRPTDVPVPVPVRLGRVVVRRAGATIEIGAIDTTIEPGSLVALLGPNGAGKTTLLDALAGLAPSDGMEAPGEPGLGRPHGTAIVQQRPETQVLGVRVIDDLVWGLDAKHLDTETLLAAVGLTGREEQATSELSGGELQRLAIAAALARDPQLLLSDESTAMLDPVGRADVMALLELARERGAAVVHSTHLDSDVERCTRQLVLGSVPSAAPVSWATTPRPTPETLLHAACVGYVHAPGTPWETRVLRDIDFAVGRGQLAVVRGANGSGKTTLSRVLAGLAPPTEGIVLLHDQPMRGPDRRVGIAFQHARLQLLRPTVREEVASLAASTEVDIDVDAALAAAGFDPDSDGSRRIDRLSGGEQRRVLLAGLGARACDVMILDEPLAGLDAPGRAMLTRTLDTFLAAGSAVIVVSHDPAWALDRADVVLDLDAGAAVPRAAL